MQGTSVVTVVGNLCADPELRYGASGTAWSRFTVAQTPRRFDQATNGWVDGDTLFMRCTVFGRLAEHVAESMAKGQRAMVVGRLRQSEWTAEDGAKRTAIELVADEVGPSLQWATASVARAAKPTGPRGEDPWTGQGASRTEPVAAGAGFSVEPPF